MSVDIFEELGLNTKYCESCGEGDPDWCTECEGCQYSECMTCICEREFELEVTYHITVRAPSYEDIDKYTVDDAVHGEYPTDWTER